jgi:hypothetical protein
MKQKFPLTQSREVAKSPRKIDFSKNLCALAPSHLCVLVLFGLVLIAGCVSKTKSRMNAQQAFIAGQQQAMMAMQQKATTVEIRGDVKNMTIPWTQDLTLAKAIVAAEYQGRHDPTSVLILRNGAGIEIKAAELLQGHDEPLLPGDIINIR